MFRKYEITILEKETGRLIKFTSYLTNWKEIAKTCEDIEKKKFQIIAINLNNYESN